MISYFKEGKDTPLKTQIVFILDNSFFTNLPAESVQPPIIHKFNL